MIAIDHRWNTSLKPLIFSFFFSIVSILVVYMIATYTSLKQDALVTIAVAIGCMQMTTQLLFFFHIGLESKVKWGFLLFIFTLLLVLIVVLGTLWIMYHLDYNLMPKMERLSY